MTNTKQLKLVKKTTLKVKYPESFVKEFNASYRQAKILEKIKENYALMKADERKKAKWILTDVESNRVWHCHCSNCKRDPQDYIGGSEDWWLIKNNLPKHCPHCGLKMES